MINRLLGCLDTFKNVHHSEAQAGRPHIFGSTPSPPRKVTQSLAQRDANTSPKPKSLFNIVEGSRTLIQIPSERTNFGNLGELALIHALIDDLNDRLIHYRKIEDEHFKSGLYHAQICEARAKTCKMKNRNTCSWKLVLIWPFSKNIPPPATQEIPDLRVTNHHGNVYNLEEVLPELDAQDFKEHVQKREEWGGFMEEYLSESYGADPALRHEREMHFRQWREEIEGKYEEDTQEEEIEFKQIKGFIPMDPILEEPDEDATSEYEASDDNTSAGQTASGDTSVNCNQSFQGTLGGDTFRDDSSGTKNIIYKASLASIPRFTETVDTPIPSVSHFTTTSEDNLEAMTQEDTRQGKWMQGMSEKFNELLRRVGKTFKKGGRGRGETV